MNPFDLDATGLMLWGLVAHLVADWPLQNDWMANNKAQRRRAYLLKARHSPAQDRYYPGRWWDRHPAAYVHAAIHGALLAVVVGWAAVPLALAHLIIDTRAPVAWWSRLIGQTQPQGRYAITDEAFLEARIGESEFDPRGHRVITRIEAPAIRSGRAPLYDIGTEVRFWTDQVFHVACLAIAALAVSA